MLGAISGVIVGVLQWPVLRRRIRAAGLWIPATAAGIAVTHGVGDAVPAAVPLVAVAAIGGAAVGLLQWLVARRSGVSALWIAAVAAAWVAGLALGYAVDDALGLFAASGPSAWASQHGIAGAFTGIATAVATAPLLPRR